MAKNNGSTYHLPSAAAGEELSSSEQEPKEEDEGWVLYGGTWVQKGKGKGKGQGKGKGKSERDPRESLCPSCGTKGHNAQQCPKPELPWSERPCHRCGEKGHVLEVSQESQSSSIAGGGSRYTSDDGTMGALR